MRVRVGYPSEDEEQAILHRFKYDEPLETLRPLVSAEQVIALQRMVRQVLWQPEVERYLLAIVRATREHPAVNLGVSPRGTLALYRACEAYAAMQGRDYVQPDDVKQLAPSVLAHRLLNGGKRTDQRQRAHLQAWVPHLVARLTGRALTGHPPGCCPSSFSRALRRII